MKRDLTNKADMADAEDYAAALAWAERLVLAAATCTLAVELLQLFWSACG